MFGMGWLTGIPKYDMRESPDLLSISILLSLTLKQGCLSS